MAKKSKAKAPAKRGAPAAKSPKAVSSPKVGSGELLTLLDFVRYAVSRFTEAKLVFAHGTTDPVAEAAFIVGEVLHLHPDQFEMFATTRVTAVEGRRILEVIDRRVATRKPAAYLVNKIYMRGLPFYVDERVIVPRSFIGELLDSHFGGEDGALVDDPAEIESVLDLCTGSGCLAILAALRFPGAKVDAVELSKDAVEVARRNVADHRLKTRVRLLRGDLFAPTKAARYDLIISNPPYVDREDMASLPPECRHEPQLAFDGGSDGLSVVRRILDEAGRHLNEGGGLLCEIGRGRALIERAYPDKHFLWLDTEASSGEAFWLDADQLR